MEADAEDIKRVEISTVESEHQHSQRTTLVGMGAPSKYRNLAAGVASTRHSRS